MDIICMGIESHLQHADNAIKNAKITQNAAQKILFRRYSNTKSNSLKDLAKLSSTMNDVVNNTNKAIKGAKLAESRAKARLAAVKKASSDTIKYTARAKRSAMASKKAAQAAAITSKKIQQQPNKVQKLHATYKIQVKAALTAAKDSEKNTKLALKSSKIARAAARIPLKPMNL